MITGRITACLVTRGDQPEMMARILETLVFDQVIVWDNSKGADWKCAGRYMAMHMAKTGLVYFQDDDVIVPRETQLSLVNQYGGEPCLSNWAHGENPDGYEDLPLVGAGAIVDRIDAYHAILRYAEHWPLDDGFKYEADFIIGVLYPYFKHVHLPFEIERPVAQHPSRLVNQPWQKELKYEMTQRARAIRDAA
ncbi:MAG TPA: hypothetical protein VLA89_03405 [Gemmatimonadales bacterium]|nr:hypothetical protein [Gemmatimonadales bacterium]